ncbi:uncharacterized protein PHACADRAFT_261654 [Phanerochaete carnosa HHB-10118-sp]|uniref:Dienelactone hydrolase domain-containing protein n=1 Tax=Phanerochaete carnosa (strain HHB-10118-sp) TaxID=650164 RepID=K5VJH7_PHACS|nr:uncharacterized protein PHACADRAFT_261654 [Phanerochaete carnosa HHB-10118-sp]EKM51493.1 hypothetical protein PHACADRAFT_261654 [Phanerochaete carnosa HHB-10118-sp]
MCHSEHCYKGYVIEGEPNGQIVDGAYFAPAPEPQDGSETIPSCAVVLLTDIFGLALKNPRIIADELAQRIGCDVWVPDLFQGRPPFTAEELEPLLPDTGNPNDQMTFMRKMWMLMLGLSRAFRLYAIRPAVVDPRAAAFIRRLRDERKYDKIGAVGYCFGGALCIRLGAAGAVDSLVVCHPTINNADQIREVRVPTAFACAEADSSFTPAIRKEAEKYFESQKGTEGAVEFEFKDYPGTVHGFATRPNPKVPEVVEAYKVALDQTAGWFRKTLCS